MNERRVCYCNSCKAEIVFLIDPRSGRKNPTNAETVGPDDTEFEWGKHQSHFETCPQAAEWRRRR